MTKSYAQLAASQHNALGVNGRPGQRGDLKDRWVVPPFSVLDARAGYWQKRKRAWLSLGIQSELGRGENTLYAGPHATEPGLNYYRRRKKLLAPGGVGATGLYRDKGARLYKPAQDQAEYMGNTGTSIFDPVLCELIYRWFALPGGIVLDPFAGGSVRGIVAAGVGCRYYGVDLRAEQIAANYQQFDAMKSRGDLSADSKVKWVVGDAKNVDSLLRNSFVDFIFTCPPYYNLEQYSDDPSDLSNAPTYNAFLDAYESIISQCVSHLRENRFACFVVGNLRGKDGFFYDLVGDTIRAFESANAPLYNEAVLLTSIGSTPLRFNTLFNKGRKLGRIHQNVVVFCKGDPFVACAALGEAYK